MPLPPADFVSYSREDSDFARQLARDLKAAGARVWLDQLDIPAGHAWDNAIEDALERSPRMLLILSPSSAKSNNVRNEISFALDAGKIIVPVLYRDCAVPLQLRRIQYIDFRKEYQDGLAALLDILKAPESPVLAEAVEEPVAEASEQNEEEEKSQAAEILRLRQEAEALRQEAKRLRKAVAEREARDEESQRLRAKAERLQREEEWVRQETAQREAEAARNREVKLAAGSKLQAEKKPAESAAGTDVQQTSPASAESGPAMTPRAQPAYRVGKPMLAAARNAMAKWMRGLLKGDRPWLLLIAVSRITLPTYFFLKVTTTLFTYTSEFNFLNPLMWSPAWLDLQAILRITHGPATTIAHFFWAYWDFVYMEPVQVRGAFAGSQGAPIQSLLWLFCALLLVEAIGLVLNRKWARLLLMADIVVVWSPAILFEVNVLKQKTISEGKFHSWIIENLMQAAMLGYLVWLIWRDRRRMPL